MKTKITRDKLYLWFIKNEPEIYDSTCKSNHNLDNFTLNVFHAEGPVNVHTLMVMTWVEANKEQYTDEDYIVLITSALLHDTGKPQCLQEMPATETKPIRNSFQGHEGVSSFIAVGILKKLQRDFPEIYTKEIIEKIIKVVSLHGTFIEETSDLYFLRCEMHKADKNGAVRSVDEAIFSQYSPRKFLKQSKINQEKRLILLIGLPNSGKSTLRNELNKFGEYFVLSRDDLLETFYEVKTGQKASYNEMYNYIHNDDNILKEFEKCFKSQIEQAQKYNNILVDMTQLSLSSRRKMLNNFQNFRKSAIVLMTDNDTLFKRNKERFEKTNKFISEKVIFNMMTSFVFPVLEEGFEDIKLVLN
jgi:adenylate kinase family enzyme